MQRHPLSTYLLIHTLSIPYHFAKNTRYAFGLREGNCGKYRTKILPDPSGIEGWLHRQKRK